ncbi:CPBP family intramembrane glutamic endopeptidase [Telluribacter sp. SYSU D00476]|uniref:CPBP family intramembrane glutamic endopeptidase n=1 Tax=Telluribacter sp. SYSU D00476 TaxID=2811430 RepID=UPI001FF13395|nr:CPBP family intramembrane glutamic endopeptidase [Telluribacter sp. SYSU D00476]
MNTKKIQLFLSFAFGISWTVGLIMYLLGVEYGTMQSTVLIALFYMTAPALATVITQKYFYKQSLKEYGLTLKNTVPKNILIAIGFYLAYVLLTMGIIFVLGNIMEVDGMGQVTFAQDEILRKVEESMKGSGDTAEVKLPPPVVLFLAGLMGGVLAGFTFNLPFTLGEELGWRGLLLKETQSLGFWKSNLLIGTIWGVWHLPIIIMGHNYPDQPIAGSLMMILFCIALSFLHAIVRLKVRTVYAPAAFHGMINAGGPLALLFIINNNVLVGSIVGLAGVIAALIITLVYLSIDRRFVAEYRNL